MQGGDCQEVEIMWAGSEATYNSYFRCAEDEWNEKNQASVQEVS